MRAYWLIITLVFLAGCATFGGFKSLPEEFQDWTKSGSSVLEIKKAMLECGIVVINYTQPEYVDGKTVKQDKNSLLLAERCMLLSGYSYKGEFGACKYVLDQSFPACQPTAIIPTRSVERRLSSSYCTSSGKNSPECQSPGYPQQPQSPSPDRNPAAEDYFLQNRTQEQLYQQQQDIQNQTNRRMKEMLNNTAPKGTR